MTGVTYDKAALTIEVDGLEGVARALEDIPQKTPAVAKVASNSSLSAELRIASYRNDLGYFDTAPPCPPTSRAGHGGTGRRRSRAGC